MNIDRLTIYTAALHKQKAFYTGALGLKPLEEGVSAFSVQVGASVLQFVETENRSRYHFAINIPSHQLPDALQWAKERVRILPLQGKEIADFPHWNAQAFYFYDAGGNIVELIARKNLDIRSAAGFSAAQSLLCISEAGLPAGDVLRIYRQLHAIGLKQFSGDFERFCAIGSETGLFIVVNYHTKKWIPTMNTAAPYPFEAIITTERAERFRLRYREEVLSIEPFAG